ncbi:MAG: aminopeptidase [Deltaproteobacteria bacterium]|nr:aminopeptidase [Deltaproteobacteria bacterium]
MLSERHLNRYGDILLWGLKTARTGRFRKGDIVLVRFNRPALRLAEILQAKLLKMGIHPVLRSTASETMEHNFFQLANNKQLVFQTPGERELYNHLNGNIFLHAPESITHLRNIDPKRIGKTAVAQKYLKDILFQREEKGDLGWTLCMLPTQELAKQAKLSMQDYTQQIIKACFLNKQSPLVHWRKIYNEALVIKKWLNQMKVKTYHIESKTIDLIITPGDRRRWIGISGHNIPSFELFMSPDWRGTKGVYYADQPSFRSGNYVKGVRLEFKHGNVVKIEAQEGEDFTRKQLVMDKGANKVGEFSLTDRRFSRIDKFMANTLYDENFGGRFGNCHLALGSSYSDTYAGDPSRLSQERKRKLGFNDSALHWDLVNTQKKRVSAHLSDGKKVTIYENGKFTC